jgi:thiamine biosynthesis lipoprotein
MPTPLSRRRFIRISAAAAGMPLLPFGTRDVAVAAGPHPALRLWRGVALGADAALQLHHPDPAMADRLVERCLAEVARLERIFSLYREDSALCQLNREGSLAAPPLDLVRVLVEAEGFSRATDGAFDATVQPLWRVYAQHFERPHAAPDGPPRAAIEEALRHIGHDAVEVSPELVRLARPGMALTLNGIAQGYITDRVVELLRAEGIDRALVDMGETRAIGDHPSGRPWSVGLEDPTMRGRIAETIALSNRAVSTSGGYGTLFDEAGRFNHIFDPGTGATSSRYLSVSVIASSATTADALSTAFLLMDPARTQELVSRLRIEAHFAQPHGGRLLQSA